MSILIPFVILFPLFAAIINYIISKVTPHLKEIMAFLTCLALFVILIYSFKYDTIYYEFYNFTFKLDGFRKIYAIITTFLWSVSLLFASDYMLTYDHKERYYLFNLLTLAFTLGLFMSNDLLTTFCFFEMMSLCAFVLIIHDEKKETIKAGRTYLIITIISGMLLFLGLVLLFGKLKTLNFDLLKVINIEISPQIIIGGFLILLGFGTKAGMFPLHIWLPKAHGVAPAPASSLLSGILTKTGIFGLIILTIIFNNVTFMGIILLVLALLTMLIGAILALFETNLKRILACSSMSQLGFIILGLAFMILLKDNYLAFEGVILHMINHSLVKLILFIFAGIIYLNTHRLNLNDLKGYGHKRYYLMICYLIAMLSLVGTPLFAGYVSKTLLHEAILDYALAQTSFNFFLIKVVEALFIICGGLTLAYLLKIFVCLFIEKNNKPYVQREYEGRQRIMNPTSGIALGIATLALLIYNFNFLYDKSIFASCQSFFNVSFFTTINYFSFNNLLGFIYSLSVGILIYFVIVRKCLIKNQIYLDCFPKTLDISNNIYKPILLKKTPRFALNKFANFIVDIFKFLYSLVDKILLFLKRKIFKQYKYLNHDDNNYQLIANNSFHKLTNIANYLLFAQILSACIVLTCVLVCIK